MSDDDLIALVHRGTLLAALEASVTLTPLLMALRGRERAMRRRERAEYIAEVNAQSELLAWRRAHT